MLTTFHLNPSRKTLKFDQFLYMSTVTRQKRGCYTIKMGALHDNLTVRYKTKMAFFLGALHHKKTIFRGVTS